MEPIDSNQLWRQIPPEEKFELMAAAHSKGIFTAIGAVIVGATLALGLHSPFFLWGTLLLSPVIFQGTASKAWRHLKPRVILEYLAARSATRRFAFSLNSSKLTLTTIIKGRFEEVYHSQDKSEELEADFSNNRAREVWIALFQDALVVISEQAGGAKLELGQLLNKHINVRGESPSGQGDYANDREIHLQVPGSFGVPRTCKLTSKYPAALIVLEKQMQKLITENLEIKEFPIAIPEVTEAPEDDFLNFSIN